MGEESPMQIDTEKTKADKCCAASSIVMPGVPAFSQQPIQEAAHMAMSTKRHWKRKQDRCNGPEKEKHS